MSAPKLGTITIGQAPRADVIPTLDLHVPAGVARVHVGVLDRLSDADIAGQFGPRPREQRMLTRLLDGRAVEVDAQAVETGVQRKLIELEDAGCTVIVVLCTGVFRGLRSRRAWLIEPDRILPALVGGLVGPRRVGVLSPLLMPLDAFRRKWAALQIPAGVAVASPYVDGDEATVAAARELQRGGANVLLMDCIGYTDRHRAAAARATGLPVLLSSDLVARVTGACLYEAP
jgi:protein AroM